ncbi:MAG: hypothetical protein JSV44_08080 [Candidatus Zixiibacteriota bacterium]|nr:MAG: hypothetical protein JSV44_08080 [candidate division Zixibacteria bacterium]
MTRKAFLLGFYSIGGQVLLIRELISAFGGDELFIGTSLFGWLLAVALGSYLGGRKRALLGSEMLFIAGAIFLPLTIIASRFSPFLYSDVIGESVPFTTAALISMVLMFPVGLISGWLFPAINREGYRPSASIVKTYLFEGIGAFVGGLAIMALVGWVFSTLAMAVALGVVVMGFLFFAPTKRNAVIISLGVLAVLVGVKILSPVIDGYLDAVKYASYRVEASFDTHYSRQAVLSRENARVLITDNVIEAVYPEARITEYDLLPPLLYQPDARHILYLGRAEFGAMQLADSLPHLTLSSLDPRRILSMTLDDILPRSGSIIRIDADPISYLSQINAVTKYDIVVLNAGAPDTYKISRYFTPWFFSKLKVIMAENGILYVPTRYDTDRHISREKQRLLSILHATLRRSFRYVAVWPGETTLFFACDDSLINLPFDSIPGRIPALAIAPAYITSYFLGDRFSEFKIARLRDALDSLHSVNNVNRPILPHYQALFRAKARGLDTAAIPFILEKPWWLLMLPIFIAVFFVFAVFRRDRRRHYGLFLYFVAGAASLTLELISFYVYQSFAGALYSEMGALIGSFMLGLAVGTFYSQKIDSDNIEFPALLLLLTATVIFLATFKRVDTNLLLYYNLLFLFTSAAATGSLFVAATRRYYFGKPEVNRGAGYALELVGSSLGALLAMTILLPVIGLQWLLGGVALFVGIALAGAMVTS